MRAYPPLFSTPETCPPGDKLVGEYFDTPPEMFPIHMFYPGFEGLRLWFPALDAWILELLFDKLKEQFGYSTFAIMEIGSFAGGSAAILSRHADYLLCADTWAGSGKDGDEMAPLYDGVDVFEVFQKNAKLFPIQPVTHKRTLEPDSLPEFLANEEMAFDLIFIDGGHDLESVRRDIAVAKEWIRPGGIICGHDFTGFPGVTQAALEFELDAACGTIWWKEMP